MSRVSTFAFALLMALPVAAWSHEKGATIAFISPDAILARNLHGVLVAELAQELAEHHLNLEFVPISDDLTVAEREVSQAVAKGPRIIIATTEWVAKAAARETRTIPILSAFHMDPRSGHAIESLSRPGRNVTGFTYYSPVVQKQFELLRRLAPNARRVGVVDDGEFLRRRILPESMEAFEKRVGVRIISFAGRTPEELLARLRDPSRKEVDAWMVSISTAAIVAAKDVVQALNESGKPALYARTAFVELGGLASLQEVISEPMKIFAQMIRLVLAGTDPSVIPIQGPSAFEFALNVATAKRQGIAIPKGLLVRANRIFGDGAEARKEAIGMPVRAPKQ